MAAMAETRTAEARFAVADWKEEVAEDVDGEGAEVNGVYYPSRGVTTVRTRYTYRGAIEGESVAYGVMAYGPGAAPFASLERFTGAIGGLEGTCVWLHHGTHEGDAVSDRFTVVDGLGTGALAGLRGEGSLDLAGHSDDGYALVLCYTV